MSRSIHSALIACLIGTSLSYGSIAMAGDRAVGQPIGLCYQDGSKGIVLEEILKAEGIPYARLRDLSELGELDLKGLILGEGFDSSAEQLKTFVENGGVLLCSRPSGRLAEALGLDEVGEQKDGYLAVQGKTAAPISHEGRFQLFGQSKCYRGGESLACLSPEEKYGGIIKVQRGSGTAYVVAFDLATTFLTILQPMSECGKHIDASHVEYDLGDVPQVDLMRRLLVGLLLEDMDVPILRKWYFPSQYRALLVVLGDQDGADFEQMTVVRNLITELETPYTLYILQGGRPITTEQFKVLAEAGMDFALHPNFFKSGGRIKFDEEELATQFKRAEADVGCAITGERPHSGRWDSVRELPVWAKRTGLQYDSVLGQKWWKDKLSKDGYWVGTGLPYHFIAPDSYRRMDVLEIPVFSGDNREFWGPKEYHVRYKPGAHKTFLAGRGLTQDEAFESWIPFLDQAIEKYPTAYGYNWHPVYLAAKELNLEERYYRTDSHFRKCINHAKSRGVGLMGTNALNKFWRARDKVQFKDIVWSPETATVHYTVSSSVKVDSLTLVAPLMFDDRKAHVCVGARTQDYTEANVLGGQYSMFAVDVGSEEIEVTVKYGE